MVNLSTTPMNMPMVTLFRVTASIMWTVRQLGGGSSTRKRFDGCVCSCRAGSHTQCAFALGKAGSTPATPSLYAQGASGGGR